MNKTILRILLAMLLLVACASIPVLADGVPKPPFCCPDCVCPKVKVAYQLAVALRWLDALSRILCT